MSLIAGARVQDRYKSDKKIVEPINRRFKSRTLLLCKSKFIISSAKMTVLKQSNAANEATLAYAEKFRTMVVSWAAIDKPTINEAVKINMARDDTEKLWLIPCMAYLFYGVSGPGSSRAMAAEPNGVSGGSFALSPAPSGGSKSFHDQSRVQSYAQGTK